MRCVIISAGSVAPCLKEQIRADDVIIACDAGYKNAEKLGVKPQIILGDFDSAPVPQRSDVLILPRVKDDTDTHYAAKLAVEKGFRSVLMLGALGGARLEHTLANLSTGLWLCKQGIQVCIMDEHSRIQFLQSGQTLYLPHEPQEYYSVFPAEGRAEGVCQTGAKYCLQNAILTAEYPLGVSNETEQGGATITAGNGALMVICTRKDNQTNATF